MKSKTQTNVKTIPIPKPTVIKESPLYRKAFYILFAILSISMLYSGWGTGFHSDEMDQNAYGKAAINYYASGGKDTSYLNLHLPDGTKVAEAISTYGVLYDMLLNTVTKSLGLKFEYDVRHFIIQLTGMFSMLFAGLIIRFLTGSFLAAIAGLLMLFFTPIYFGHSLMNARDIPFAFGYTMAVYFMLKYFRQFKRLEWKPLLLLALAMGISASVRIGGIILIPIMLAYLTYGYFFVNDINKTIKQNIGRIFLQFTALLAIIYAFALISHPIIFRAPIDNLMLCIDTASRFPNKIPLNFGGDFISSLEIPKSYLPVWYMNTVPLIIIISFAIGLIYLLFKWRSIQSNRLIALVLLCFAFPVSYAIIKSFSLYNGWRHLLFAYPCAIVIATYWISKIKLKPNFKPILPIIILLGLAHPITKMVKHHPYEYMYFNEISGGFEKNYLLYETDVWQLSIREAMDWLMHDKTFLSKKNNIIGCNSYSPAYDLLLNKYEDTSNKIVYAGHKNKNMKLWNYMIFNVNLLPPIILEHLYPPPKTIKTIEIEGKPICAIIYDPVRNDYRASMALDERNFRASDSLFIKALEDEPESERLLEGICISKARQDKIKEAKKYYMRGINIYPQNGYFNYFVGMEAGMNREYAKAIETIYKALEFGLPESESVYMNLSVLYSKNGNEVKSKEMYENALKMR